MLVKELKNKFVGHKVKLGIYLLKMKLTIKCKIMSKIICKIKLPLGNRKRNVIKYGDNIPRILIKKGKYCKKAIIAVIKSMFSIPKRNVLYNHTSDLHPKTNIKPIIIKIILIFCCIIFINCFAVTLQLWLPIP